MYLVEGPVYLVVPRSSSPFPRVHPVIPAKAGIHGLRKPQAASTARRSDSVYGGRHTMVSVTMPAI